MIRVLVVEDSPTARALLVAALSRDPEIRVVGEATNGAEGVALAKTLSPDVVSMDVELPGIDGYEATRMIMSEAPVPVVIVTSLDVRDVERSMRALQIGAVALMPKPPPPASPSFDRACRELCETMKAMAEVKVVRRMRIRAFEAQPEVPRGAKLELVAVAASTGGPKILAELLSALHPSFEVPILIVQHIAAGFADGLARWLSSVTQHDIRIAIDGEKLDDRSVRVAPTGVHLRAARRGIVHLGSERPLGGFRPSATVLFQSVADVYGSACAGVILTGMGSDGVLGLSAIHAAGGRVLAQDETSSLVYGMPKAAMEAGVVDAQLSPSGIAQYLIELARGGRS